MDFEILVTNHTLKAFLVPRALHGFEVEDASNLLEPHQDASIGFLLERPGAQPVFLDGNIVLDGKESVPRLCCS